MRILVTGANGYLGKGILSLLSDTNNEIIASARKFDSYHKNVTYKECDIFEIDDPFYYFCKPDVVLHLAWSEGFVHMSESHIVNLPLHYAFLKKLITCGAKRISVLGSVHEIGFYEGSVNEFTPCYPQSLYGISKNALRMAIELLCKTNKTILQWIRGFYIVGNNINGSSIFSKISKAVQEGKVDFPFTMGLNQFDFLDYDIFCNYVCKIILQDKINGIINCCSGRPEKLSNIVEKFIKDNHFNIKLIYGAFPDRPYDSKAIWGDNSKLLEILKLYI